MTFSRRPDPRFNRGRIATVAGESSGYIPPSYPTFLNDTGGVFYWAEDITDPATWAPRFDSLGAGPLTGVNTTLEAAGWAQPEGASKSMRIDSAASAYLINNNLAAMLNADDAPVTFSIGMQNISVSANNYLVCWSSSASSTPKRVLRYIGSGGYLWTQQSTTSTSGHYAAGTLQQMVTVRQINNGAGTTLDLTRNVEADPSGSLTMNVGAQNCDRFCIGCIWNGVSGPGLFSNVRIKWFLLLPSGASLTTAQEVELHNWIMGAYNTAPLYSGSDDFLLQLNFGQSNCLAQGIATGAVAGLPDAQVKEMMRTPNNGVVNPVGLKALDLRTALYHGAQHYIQTGSYAKPHHFAGVGQGATSMGSAGWEGAGPVNSSQGLYATTLSSECRRNILTAKARFGGVPRIQRTWWQGESDCAISDPTNYATLFGNVDAYINKYIVTAFGAGYANTPFHLIKLNATLQTGGGINPAWVGTHAAQLDAYAAANPAYVRTLAGWSALTGAQYIGPDSLHMTDAACPIVAADVVASIKSMDPAL